MDFKKEQIHDYYLLETNVENIFINEYMVAAPGDYVKVYLFALLYAELKQKMNNTTMAKLLRMDEGDVLKAWTYWESMGVIRKHYIVSEDKFKYKVEFLSLKEKHYGNHNKKKTKAGAGIENDFILGDLDVKKMYGDVEKSIGRPLGGTEIVEIISWIKDFGATPQMITSAYSYCVKTRKKDNSKYVAAVVKEWAEKGLTDEEKIGEHLAQVDKRHFQYKRILRALGFSRNATEEEKRLMDVWFDEMDMPLDKVLAACTKTSGIPNPNMNYVNKILEDWSKGGEGNGRVKKGITAAMVFKYYDYIRENAEKEAEERKLEVYRKVSKIKDIDEELRHFSMEVSRVMISGGADKKQRLSDLKKKGDRLNSEKSVLLTENNFTIEYMDVKYLCPLCKDLGTNQEGERCTCFPQRLSEAEEWQNSVKI